MVWKLKNSIIIKILPDEKTWEATDTEHDQLIVLGWNMYRDELLRLLKLK